MNATIMQSFGALLLASRQAKNKTRASIARELGVNIDGLMKIEHGVYLPKEEKLPQFADAYGIELAVCKAQYDIVVNERDSEPSVRSLVRHPKRTPPEHKAS